MQEERVLALESLRATAEDLLPYDPADIYASTSTPILPHLLLLLMVKLEYIYIYIPLKIQLPRKIFNGATFKHPHTMEHYLLLKKESYP
jgi:hypothetical protein